MIFDALVCDLDGVVYRGDEVVPGAPEAIETLRSSGVAVLFCTNNSRRTPADYVTLLRGFGVPAAESDVLTSAEVTADELERRGYPGKTAFVVGGEGIRAALRRAGLEVLAPDDDAGRADVVAVGWDRSFTYERLRRAATLVRGGAFFVATNDDATFPAAGGVQWPGAGSLLAAVETASGRRAEVMGKPHAPMAEAAARRLPRGARVAVVGDRPDTDLALADRRGWIKILVLSGVTDEAGAAALEAAPDLVVGSLADIAPSQ